MNFPGSHTIHLLWQSIKESISDQQPHINQRTDQLGHGLTSTPPPPPLLPCLAPAPGSRGTGSGCGLWCCVPVHPLPTGHPHQRVPRGLVHRLLSGEQQTRVCCVYFWLGLGRALYAQLFLYTSLFITFTSSTIIFLNKWLDKRLRKTPAMHYMCRWYGIKFYIL